MTTSSEIISSNTSSELSPELLCVCTGVRGDGSAEVIWETECALGTFEIGSVESVAIFHASCKSVELGARSTSLLQGESNVGSQGSKNADADATISSSNLLHSWNLNGKIRVSMCRLSP